MDKATLQRLKEYAEVQSDYSTRSRLYRYICDRIHEKPIVRPKKTSKPGKEYKLTDNSLTDREATAAHSFYLTDKEYINSIVEDTHISFPPAIPSVIGDPSSWTGAHWKWFLEERKINESKV